jgi:hypothetical protein
MCKQLFHSGLLADHAILDALKGIVKGLDKPFNRVTGAKLELP